MTPAGQPTPGTQLRVVDPDTLRDLPDGSQGLLLARGPGVLAGYYADPGATAKVGRAAGCCCLSKISAAWASVWCGGGREGQVQDNLWGRAAKG
jgi:acyl-CoA synthetase (AMP-forming)/AMP-acid ligase II